MRIRLLVSLLAAAACSQVVTALDDAVEPGDVAVMQRRHGAPVQHHRLQRRALAANPVEHGAERRQDVFPTLAPELARRDIPLIGGSTDNSPPPTAAASSTDHTTAPATTPPLLTIPVSTNKPTPTSSSSASSSSASSASSARSSASSSASSSSSSSSSDTTPVVVTTTLSNSVVITSSSTPDAPSSTPSGDSSGSGSSSSNRTGLIIGVSVVGGVALLATAIFLYVKFGQKRFSGFDDDDGEIKWPELAADGDSSALHPLPARRTGGAGFDMGDDASISEAGGMGASRESFTAPSASHYNAPGAAAAPAGYYDDPSAAYGDPSAHYGHAAAGGGYYDQPAMPGYGQGYGGAYYDDPHAGHGVSGPPYHDG